MQLGDMVFERSRQMQQPFDNPEEGDIVVRLDGPVGILERLLGFYVGHGDS